MMRLSMVMEPSMQWKTNLKEYINQIKNFVLWHYQFGSKYDASFWDYAKTLAFEDNIFDQFRSCKVL